MKRKLAFLFVSLFFSALSFSQGLIISEFRLRGPNGANDEYIEIYNNSDNPHTVAAISGSGYGIAASDGIVRGTIPNGTIIPARGHYLFVNSVGYSLASYPAGNGTTATGDATYTTGIADNAGIALFNNNTGGASFSLANRLDAVGSTSEANTLYKEGAGYPALVPFSIDYCFHRREMTGLPVDSDDNAADFKFEDTNGTSAGAGQSLGAPGPENLSSPITRGGGLVVAPLDNAVSPGAPPNIIRDFTSDPANNSTFGTLDFRLKVTNNTGGNITRLRFRVVDLSTFPSPSGIADLRPRTSTAVVVTTSSGNVTVQGTTLEQPSSQPNGGGINSSMGVGVITLGTPLANGATQNIRLLCGIQQTGTIKVDLLLEALPDGGGGGTAGSGAGVTTPFFFRGTTDGPKFFNVVPTSAQAGDLLISEFRVRGPNGANDEFVEIYNNGNADHTVFATSGGGYGLYASDGVLRGTIPNGIVIPAKGHYLFVNSVGYSLASYPAGNGTTATGDATYTTDIPDNAGIALFNNNFGGGNLTLANRLDAVGSTSEANTLYKEGSGYAPLVPFSINYNWRRKTYNGPPVDNNDNAADFEFDDTNGTSAGGGQRLGAPGPENLSSPLSRNANLVVTRLDPLVDEFSPPNRVRDFTSDPVNNSTFGTIDVRYRVTNNTGVPITRLRFRFDSISTFPQPSGFADMRPRTSTTIVVTTSSGNETVEGTTLEQPPSQPNGGGFNSSLSAGVVTLGTPLANGASTNIRLLFGLQQDGAFAVKFTPEVLPVAAATGLTPEPVLINGLCTLTCPANIVVDNTPGQCGAIVNYPAPTASGGCGTVVATPASGSFFPVGTTTVTVSTSSGATCSFTVTVNDTQPPTVTCPSNITVSNTPGTCGAVVTYAAPTASDNCPGVTVVSSPASGSVFPVGTTTVTATATDAAGNTSTCTFTVTVNDTQAPVITCPANITTANDPGQCGATVTYSLPTISDNCPGATLAAPQSDNNAFNGITFDLTNNTSIPMTITGFMAPIGVGTHPVEVYYTTSASTAVGNEQNAGAWTLLGTTTVTGSGAFPSIGMVSIPVGGLVLPAGASKGIYLAVTDGAEFGYSNGNATATDGRLTITSNNHRGGQYPFINNNVPRRFYGSVSYNYVLAPVQTAGLPSGSLFPVGTTTNVYQATDAAGNTSTCSFTVTVNDTQVPTVSCPANITVSNAPGTCGATVTYAAPTASDNCPGVTVVASPASGSVFPVGTTTVTATATDAAGNTATCSFTVTVNDVQPPVITCPSNITINASAGQCAALVNTPNPVNTDNCAVTVRTWTLSGATIGASPATGVNNVGSQTFNVGVTTVTYTSRDAAGNTATCSFTVTVVDNQPPVITCPSNITVSNDPGQCGAVVNYALPSALDNCNRLQVPQTILPHGGGAITVAGNNAPGGFYFDLTNNSATPKTVSSLSVRFGSLAFGAVTSPTPVSVYVTTSATTYVGNQANAGAWTPVGVSIPVTVAGTNSEFSQVPLPGGGFTLAPGQSRGVYVFGVTQSLVYNSAANSNTTPITNGVMTVTPGQASSGLFVAAATPRVPNVIINYITLTQTAGLPRGALFPVGTTTNTWQATDDAGNSSSCSFTVTVNDTQAPTITCPGNITVTTPVGSCTAVVTYTATTSDNCPGATVQVVSGPASGAAFPVGTTTVTLRARDAAGNFSAPCSFTVTVLDGQLPVISAQPANRSVCAGTNATFSVTATNAVSYQWQSWNGTAWVDISGATAATFTVSNAAVSQNNTSYRVRVIGLCTTVISNHATLQVNPNPTVSITPSIPPALLPGQTLTLTAQPNPAGGGSYQWQLNGANIAGATSQSLEGITVDRTGLYRVIYTDGNGCVGTSAALEVTAKQSGNLWVYPNPNQGIFNIRFFNRVGDEVTVRVFDTKGAMVYQQKVLTTAPYTNIQVNLTSQPIASESYVVEIRDGQGVQVGAKRIIVYR